MIGQRVGHYDILEKLGEGGMGVVYKARDTHLNRFVGIKVLPAAKMAGLERKRRFVQEARAASALNHPGIITIHDIAEAEGIDFIVMEYVPGKTLDQLIQRRGLRLSETLKYAAEIADALAAAHGVGIVHRDLKPTNLMVSDQGRVKVLDFGLAKLSEPAPATDDAPTETLRPSTEEGVVFGTTAYMSPEQAQGRHVDTRSDIFSFGSVLYEMVAGRRAFARESTLSTLAAILNQEPASLPSDTPRDLEKIINRCLRKDPARRFQHMIDVKVALEELKEESGSGKLTRTPGMSRSWSRLGWTTATLAGMVLVAAAVLWHIRRGTQATAVNPLANARFSRMTNFGAERDAVLSPDGKLVAFVSDRNGIPAAWIGQVGSGDFTNLTKDRFSGHLPLRGFRVRALAFSADSTQLAVMDGPTGRTWLFPAMGGNPRLLLDPGIEVMWSADGSRLVYHTLASGDPIFVAEADGSNAKQIFVDKAGAHCHYPTWSPDGRFIYFVRGYPTADETDIWRVPAGGGEAQRITYHNALVESPAFLDSRTLLYSATAEDGPGFALYAMDLDRRIPLLITHGVQQYPSVSASVDGKRIVVTESNPLGRLWTVPISEHVLGKTGARRVDLPTVRAIAPRYGPSYFLYLSSITGADGLWKSMNGGAMELWKPAGGGLIAAPAIDATGRQIVFAIRKQGRTALYRINEAGANPTRLAPALRVRGSPSWSPDGNWIVVSGDDGKGAGIFKVPVQADGTPVRLWDGLCFGPTWSPDGQRILCSEPFAGPDLRIRALAPGGTSISIADLRVNYRYSHFRFLSGGNRILVSRGESFWSVDLATGTQRRVANLEPGLSPLTFDVSPDGKEVMFDHIVDNTDIVLIEPGRGLPDGKQ